MNDHGVGATVVLALGCGLAGACVGWLTSRRSRPGGSRWLGRLLLLAIALPVVLILLAKLFDSNTLGLAFGATLIAEALALPFAALFGAGWSIGSAFGRRRRAVSSTMAAEPMGMLLIRLDRDSVCAGDDTDPHGQLLEADPRTSVAQLLDRIQRMNYLASIAGGRATWVAMASCGGRQTVLGVVAQQWPAPRLCVAADDPLSAHFDGPDARLHFRYEAQAEPDAVRDRLAQPRVAGRAGSTGPWDAAVRTN